MNIVLTTPMRLRPQQGSHRGSALVIILILISLMAALMVGNAVTLRRLKTEIQHLDQKQQQRITSNPSQATHR